MKQNDSNLDPTKSRFWYQTKKRRKMIALILVFAFAISIFLWNKFSEEVALSKIPQSNNISYDTSIVKSLNPTDVVNDIELHTGKPIILHIYATWCSICKKQLPEINELSRIFQNTEARFIVIAIDKNITTEDLTNYLNYYGNIYFDVKHLTYSDGLSEALKQKSIFYNKKIPFTALISQNGKVVTQFNGHKSKSYLQKRIIKLLGRK